MKTLLFFCILQVLSTASSDQPQASDDFAEYRQDATKSSPIYEAAQKIGYGQNALQPYYLCDAPSSGSAMPLNAWHYSCKLSCSDEMSKSYVNITRAVWHYVGSDVPTYKVSTNEVCYTAHENIWGYCTHTQTITPIATTLDDRNKIPQEYLVKNSKIQGVQTIINSGHAECEYLTDNTKCAKDYVITYRPGKTSKKHETSPIVLNIYGDGIRVDPHKGSLIQNEVAWFWNPDNVDAGEECGWTLYDTVTCRMMNTSEVLSCPDIGYQYNLNSVHSKKTCAGELYDIDGPAPFKFLEKKAGENHTKIVQDALTGKGDSDVNLIKGVNTALSRIEEAYCSSTCDIVSRATSYNDNHVLDTPLGNWRLSKASTATPLMVPCVATANWRAKSPTTMCHGRNHILVIDSKTNHVLSWDTMRDYVTSGEVCNDPNDKTGYDVRLRRIMSENKDITIDFWTGDSIIISPPYDAPRWENHSKTFIQNPSWFAKVELNKGMLHNKDDMSELMTIMANEMKTEIAYNKTSVKSVRALFFDEVLSGVENVAGSIWSGLISFIGGMPKFILLVLLILGSTWVLREVIMYYIRKKSDILYTRPREVRFESPERHPSEMLSMVDVPSAPTKRGRSRSRQMSAVAKQIML